MSRTAVCIVAAAALLAAGCGSSDENAADDETPGISGVATDTGQTGMQSTTPSGEGRSITIRESEFELDPATVKLDEAGTYTFHVVNAGGTTHALEIEGNGVEEESATLDAGDSDDLTVELAAGTYEIYCPIGNHREQGMEGTLTVGGGSGGAGATTGDDDEDASSAGYG